MLSAIRYQTNEAVLHTDRSLLPRARGAWTSWNYRIPAETKDRVLVTYDMTRLQSLSGPSRLLVTLNPDNRIDPSKVLLRERYDHPVFNADAVSAQERFDAIDGGGGVHFCGAYWRYGFHEDGWWSGVRVADRINRGS